MSCPQVRRENRYEKGLSRPKRRAIKKGLDQKEKRNGGSSGTGGKKKKECKKAIPISKKLKDGQAKVEKEVGEAMS